ncbi:FecR family protein [Pseudobacter ginsenosidimutans]|uniref:FecR family protein n=1 Tax=Pseudobacter ginsenosidimutans TaxID=661488 RepID=A0A4Q7N3H1_9BACT|nr:FecR family protein [Pseudobacter ginsenosidimutans]QEC43702.1 DUF4974 domain-containing protein [Pseudobacter ginsenosidimutans]RZS75108.1 FecR family protein [Pseudobacter ginsenosidimutans]
MNERLLLLLQKVRDKNATDTEHAELLAMIAADEPGDTGAIINQFHNWQSADAESYSVEEMDSLFAGIITADKAIPVRKLSYRKWAAAAAVLLLLTTSVYFWLNDNKDQVAITETPVEILPGRDGAVLTLADGREVVLDSLGNGVVAHQNGIQVLLKDGQLSYDPVKMENGQVQFNTMTVPRGRQFRLQLPDGTNVWLNSASSIRYPVVFTGAERKIAITGEAYFEVAKYPDKPFMVTVNNKARVEVLGTHFNINAYDNEDSIHTTLLEGAVRVHNRSNRNLLLKPGQQAVIPANQDGAAVGIALVKNVNLEKVMAWRNGLFNFEGASLQEVLKQLERWYDIEPVFQHGIPDIRFSGEMTRDMPLSGLLIGLERSGVRLRLEGKKLLVLP